MEGIARAKARAVGVFLAAAASTLCSCQGPYQVCKPIVPAVAERESGTSFEVKKVDGVVVSPPFPAETGEEVLVTRDGAVHLFVYPLAPWETRPQGDYSLDRDVNYWKFHAGSWTDFGVIAGGRTEYGIDEYYDIGTVNAVEMPDGLLFLVVSGLRFTREGPPYSVEGEVLIGQGQEWKEVAEVGLHPFNLEALVHESGNVHLWYIGMPGILWLGLHAPFAGPRARWATYLYHAFWPRGRPRKKRRITTRGYINVFGINPTVGPNGSVYVAFGMSGSGLESVADPPCPTACVSVYKKGSWKGPFGLVTRDALEALAGPPVAGEDEERKALAGGPYIAVDSQNLCHIAWESVYLQFRDGACSEPWVVLKGAAAKGIFHDAHGRLVIFLAHRGKLVARIREERGWSKPCSVAETDEACPLRGNDGHLYLLWPQAVDEHTVRLGLQRIGFEETGEVAQRQEWTRTADSGARVMTDDR